MSAMRCRYESETIRALQTGVLSEALIEHQKRCADCRQEVMVAEALQWDARGLAIRYTPPSSGQIWAVAERHRRTAALARATRFLLALKIAGMVYAVVFVLWGLHALAAHGIPAPWLEGKSLNTVMEGAGLAMLFVSSGLWYMLRGDKQLPG